MAIVKEFLYEHMDGMRLFRTYSDTGKYIRKEGTAEIYEDAVDVENSNFTYVETEESIPQFEGGEN